MNTPPTLLYLQFRPCSFPAFWTFPDVRGSRCCCGCSDLSPRCPAQSQQVSECSVPIWLFSSLCQSGLIRKAPLIYLKFRCVRKETEAEQNKPTFLAAFSLVLCFVLFCFQQAKPTLHNMGNRTPSHSTSFLLCFWRTASPSTVSTPSHLGHKIFSSKTNIAFPTLQRLHKDPYH